jgi:hypothetical protein
MIEKKKKRKKRKKILEKKGKKSHHRRPVYIYVFWNNRERKRGEEKGDVVCWMIASLYIPSIYTRYYAHICSI